MILKVKRMNKLYVVLGEAGEYSDRNVWVSGVFDTQVAAQDLVEELALKHRLSEEWDKVNRKHFNALKDLMHVKAAAPMYEHQRVVYNNAYFAAMDELRDEAKRLAGPKPEYVREERCEVVEVDLNKWMTTNENN